MTATDITNTNTIWKDSCKSIVELAKIKLGIKNGQPIARIIEELMELMNGRRLYRNTEKNEYQRFKKIIRKEIKKVKLG